jgi:NADH-quinone oxidoreductase subunit M
MSPASRGLFEIWPYLAAFGVGALLPRRQGWAERIGIGIVAALSLALVLGLWPGVSETDLAQPPPEEWPQLLNVIVFLPIVGALAILFLPRQAPNLLRRFTLLVLALDFLASLFLLRAPMTGGWHFQYISEWLPTFGIRYHVAVDGISLWLIILTTLTTPIAAYVSFGSIKQRTKDLCFAYLLLHGAMLGAFVSLDLFLFFVFWELMLVPMLLMIGIWGSTDRIKAAYKFFIYTMVGSMMMLAAILYMVWTHTELAGYPSFDYLALSRLALPRTAGWLCFIGFALAFVIKVPMWPVHTWLPDAHVQAPTGGSIVLAAVLLKLGTYGYMRFCMGMLGGPAYAAAANLAGVAVAGGILYGALVAWKQDDMKRLIAYSSVAHMGFIMLGLFAATKSGIQGAIIQMINHGISTGALFLLVGVIYDRRHTRLIREFGGLAKPMPIYAAIFVIITMSSIGVPGTNGFVGEFMIIIGTFSSQTLGSHGQLQAVLAAAGVILAAVYMLSVVQRVFFGPITNPRNERLLDLNVRETLSLAPLVALVFVIGLFPNIFISRTVEASDEIFARYKAGRNAYVSADPESKQATLLPRGAGPYEKGYPKSPDELKKEAEERAKLAEAPSTGDAAANPAAGAPPGGMPPGGMPPGAMPPPGGARPGLAPSPQAAAPPQPGAPAPGGMPRAPVLRPIPPPGAQP